MGSLNRWIGIGNLGRDIETRYTANGDAVGTLNMACSESWKDKSGAKQERTEWVRVVLWGKSVEALAPYLLKGKSIAVEGRLQTRKYEKDGQTHYATEIKADRVTLLGGGPRENRQRSEHVSDEQVAGGMSGAVGDEMSGFVDNVPFSPVV